MGAPRGRGGGDCGGRYKVGGGVGGDGNGGGRASWDRYVPVSFAKVGTY